MKPSQDVDKWSDKEFNSDILCTISHDGSMGLVYLLLEPETSTLKWLFQLDDSKSLHRKLLFHQTSIYKWLFRVPGLHLVDFLWFSCRSR